MSRLREVAPDWTWSIVRSFVAGILDDDHDRVTRLDCDLMQGYHLAKPLSPVDLIHWLEQRRQAADKAA